MTHPDIPESVLAVQVAASDPATSAWVAANAGSGKTYVLAQRVIRLMLDGTEPAKILCLTFTKAAAANMATQVFSTLAKWTALDDAALDAAVARIEGKPPSARRRRRARRLFAEALEAPGGLKVRTIHAFCAGLLHQFPFEADVAARFEVLEERAEAALIDKLRLEVLQDAAAEPESPLGRALETAITAAADVTFAEVVREAIGQRDAITAWLGRAGGLAAATDELSRALGVGTDATRAAVEAEMLKSPILPASDWPALAAALAQGAATDREHVARLEAARGGTEWENIEAWLQIFCTEALAPRKHIVTKVVRDAHPALDERLRAEQARICALIDRRRAIVLRDRTAALITIAQAVIGRYRAEKERRGLLDYDDLIDKTLELLSRVDAAWVHYKLDLGVDHVLIDEAQDTSPKQWEVIRALLAEFFAGAGARGALRRSVFAVGDEKQSIYSFQGAAPHAFEEMRKHFGGAHEKAGLPFETLPFRYSFRSAPDVLDAVDTVFGRPEAFRGLTADPVATVHEAVRRTAPGFVEVWPLVEAEKTPEREAWDAPFDAASEASPQARLAQRIACTVRTWITRGDRLAATSAAIRPGDVLVLVRQRGALFEAIIRALKETGVEVAGADRLILTEHIAVMDLMSLADALLLPGDDLALAEALKSPLFGFEDQHLFELAWGRTGTLREALRTKAADDLIWRTASDHLDCLAVRAREDTPFAFYADLLGRGGARRKMLARLGLQAADALEEFLALALDYERRETPSLQGFLAWLRASPTEVKRDMEIGRDEVRVMTVHGAKGLEAPVVIIADTAARPTGPRDPRLLRLGGVAPPLVWAGARDTDVGPVAAAREAARGAAEDEYRRLLYVAMTRAADRLVVCGAQGLQAKPKGCWYDLVYDALVPSATAEPADDGVGEVWRWRKSRGQVVTAAEAVAPAAEREPIESPGWFRQDAPAIRGTAEITPSAAVAAEAARMAARAGFGAAAEAKNLARGRHVHRLLQALPGIPAERWAEAAQRHLARADPPLEAPAVEEIVSKVLTVLADPVFAPLFAAGTRAEAPIVGRLAREGGRPLMVAGQIDRLAVTGDMVLMADYKTDRTPPDRVEDVPDAYISQLALYRAVLARLYPGRAIRAVLVWTEVPRLMELPPEALDTALARLGVACGAP